MSNTLYHLANDYINFAIEGKKVRIPYAIERHAIKKYGIGSSADVPTTGRFENFAGKGTTEQIRDALIKTAKKEKFNLSSATTAQIYKFMESHGIGIDCSGFVYNVLDGYLQKERRKSLDTLILRYSGLFGKTERFLLQKNRVRRTSAETLTNDLNTIRIEKVKDIKPGEEVTEEITKYLKEYNIQEGGIVSIIGAVDKCKVSTMTRKDANINKFKIYKEPLELSGTGEIKDGKRIFIVSWVGKGI